MSSPEEDTYSIMFTSLRHPARRKILRMLSEKPRNFSEILEQLRISSSHLTYHLENLGDLVSKMEDGRYKLSTFGEAAVATMSSVEELRRHQIAEPRQPISRRKRVPTSWVVLMIGIITLASVSIIQYRFLNQLSVDYEKLKTEHDVQYQSLTELSAKYEQLEAKYEEMTTGERIPEAWELTIRNLLESERIKQQATPQLEKLKDEGVPIWDITAAIDSTEKWIKLFVLMEEIRPEYEAKLMELFGSDVPIAFHQMDEETWLYLSKAQSYYIVFDISRIDDRYFDRSTVALLMKRMPLPDR